MSCNVYPLEKCFEHAEGSVAAINHSCPSIDDDTQKNASDGSYSTTVLKCAIRRERERDGERERDSASHEPFMSVEDIWSVDGALLK